MKQALSEKEVGRRSRFMTTYPSPKSEALLKRSAVTYNLAINCWASTLYAAIRSNEQRFTPKEWALLRDKLYVPQKSPLLDPGVSCPGQLLADHVERLGGEPLASKLAALDYPAAWAVVWVCHFGPDDGQWWTVRALVNKRA